METIKCKITSISNNEQLKLLIIILALKNIMN